MQAEVAADTVAAAQAAGLLPPAKRQRGAPARRQSASPAPQGQHARFISEHFPSGTSPLRCTRPFHSLLIRHCCY